MCPRGICVLLRTKRDRTFQTFVFLQSEQWNQKWNPSSPTPEVATRKLTEKLFKNGGVFLLQKKNTKNFHQEDLTPRNFCIWLHTDPQTAPLAHPDSSFFKLKKKISSLTALGMLFARCEGVSSCPVAPSGMRRSLGTALQHPKVLLPQPGTLGPLPISGFAAH